MVQITKLAVSSILAVVASSGGLGEGPGNAVTGLKIAESTRFGRRHSCPTIAASKEAEWNLKRQEEEEKPLWSFQEEEEPSSWKQRQLRKRKLQQDKEEDAPWSKKQKQDETRLRSRT